MKRLLQIAIILAFLLALPASTMAHTGDDPFVTDLIAGGGNVKSQIDAGDMSIWNDEDNLYVKYETVEPWCLLSTELHVGDKLADIPMNKNSSPKIGHFEYKTYYSPDPCVTERTYTISLADHDLDYLEDAYIAAHAEVVNPTVVVDPILGTYWEETAWGAGTRFNNKNWSMYIIYNVQEPVIPTPGKDIVVFNDINPFDNYGMENPNNPLMVANLVNFTTPNPRGSGTVVWFDRGRGSRCGGWGDCNDANLLTMRSVINAAGYSITNIYSDSGTITSIPADVKVVFLWNPTVPYTTAEINVFKQFAAEGGRLVFVGEHAGYYGSWIPLENQFLLDMGAVMTNIGNAVDCGYNDLPATSLRPHQITTGMTGVRIACASVIVPGPEDYPFMYDTTNTMVLAGVAKIDTTPLPLVLEGQMQSLPQPNTGEEGLNPSSATGY